MKNYRLLIAMIPLLFAGFTVPVAHAQKPKIYTSKKTAKTTSPDDSAEPDKVLYDRAMLDVKQRKYTEARLDLQTLINTYPDSEYLAKAKLGVADSYYNEGGDSNLTQAVDEYKNFIVFFPFLDEAQYAQMQVGMSHYRMMGKSDRDNSQAQQAEDEFRTFLLKYPQSPLAPKAEQYLRDVQEVLADGEFKIGRFYYAKQDYRASAARLVEVSIRYPLYSQSDDNLLLLGNIYERAKQASKNEDDKNHWADLAAKCYDRIVRDYPLSPDVPAAKAKLKLMSMPIPAADPAAVARMKKEQMYEKEHHANVLNAPLNMMKSNPDVYAAAHYGQPNLDPPDDLVSATEVLNQGAAGPSFSVATVTTSRASQSVTSDSDSHSSPAVDTESVDTSDGPSAAPADTPTASAATTQDPAVAGESSSATTSSTDEGSATTAAAPQSGTSSSTQSAQSSTGTSASASSTESSSKKKKGLRKIIPF